jgi:enoyl-CoA hydratase/carnithine racemase
LPFGARAGLGAEGEIERGGTVAFVDYDMNDKHVVTITINRPDRMNALGLDTVHGIREAFERFEADGDARVAILTGVGRSFSAGQDVKELAGGDAPVPVSAHVAVDVVKKPVIAAVNGYALGGGCLLMLACDIRIATERATFAMAEIKWAIPLLVDRFLSQNIPMCVIMELLLTGDQLDAQRAYNAGLINTLVPEAELMTEAMAIAEKIAELSPAAVRTIKQSKIDCIGLSERDLEVEENARQSARKTPDHQEATRAARENRQPVYQAHLTVSG